MNLVALILYGLVNGAMALTYLFGKNRIYEFPFWAAAISLGWFFPQAIGGYLNIEEYPDGAYAAGLFFATFCSMALWGGYHLAVQKQPAKPTWLDLPFFEHKLYWAGAALCCMGFYFQWKLLSLPEEMLSQTQWSGATVKYLFLASISKIGFVVVWLLYLEGRKLVVPKLLLFVLPGLLMVLSTAFVQGRRAGMMNLVAYVFVGLWFTRRIMIPRWMVLVGLVLGLTLVNAIGTYRAIMHNREMSLAERLSEASKADYSSGSKKVIKSAGVEFNNYIIYRKVYAEQGKYDFGLIHWNGFVGNYVPAKIVGRATKQALMFPLLDVIGLAKEKYGHSFGVGSTVTGYCDAFGSFGWLGFIKFWVIGGMMGILYRHAMQGSFLGQLLYVYMLSTAMISITHATHPILVSSWVYFLALGYPVIRMARASRDFQGLETPPPLLAKEACGG